MVFRCEYSSAVCNNTNEIFWGFVATTVAVTVQSVRVWAAYLSLYGTKVSSRIVTDLRRRKSI